MKIRNCQAMTLSATAVAALGLSVVHAGEPDVVVTKLYVAGDMIGEVGAFVVPNSVDVNNDGNTLVTIETDAPTTHDVVVVLNGTIVAQEDQPIAPKGAVISSFDSVRVNNVGNIGWNFFLDNLPSNQDSGIYFNTTLVLQESTISTAAGFSPDTPYIGFFETRMNDNHQFLLVASVDDPAIPSSVDRALVILDYDPKTNLFTETVLAKEGDVLSGQTEAVADFGTGPHASDFNNAGQVLYLADLTGPTANDLVLYRDMTLLLQEGSPSPIKGRNFNLTTSSPVSMNESGDWAVRTTLTGDSSTAAVIVVNGAIVQQQGNAAPGTTEGETITDFGSGPIFLADDGDVIYYAALSGDASGNQALYKGEQLLLRKGDTVDGMIMTSIGGTTATGGVAGGFSISRNGRYAIARVVFNTGPRGVVLVDRGTACSGPADLNCDGVVNVDDLLIILNNWGQCADCNDCIADIAGDCTVNVDDLLIILNNWG